MRALSPKRRPLVFLGPVAMVAVAACANDYSALDVSGSLGEAQAPGTGGAAGGPPSAGGASAGGVSASGGTGTGGGGAGSSDASTDGPAPNDANPDGGDGAPDAGGQDASPGTGGAAAGGAGGGASDASAGGAGAGGAGAGGAGTGGAGTGGAGTGGTPADAGPPSCDTLYGATAGYQLCAETAGACRFHANLTGSNCGALCGTACIDQNDNTGPCGIGNAADTCTGPNRQDAICECERR